MSDPQSFCPFCKREHDAPEMLELTNRANHEERLRRSAEADCVRLGASLEDEIRKSSLLPAMSAELKDAVAQLNEESERRLAAESRLGSALGLLREVFEASDVDGRDMLGLDLYTRIAGVVEKRPEVQGVKWLSLEEMKERYPNEGSDVENRSSIAEDAALDLDDAQRRGRQSGLDGYPPE